MTTLEPNGDSERLVLVFAPIGRDAELTRGLLERASIPSAICHSIAALTEALTEGAGALVSPV